MKNLKIVAGIFVVMFMFMLLPSNTEGSLHNDLNPEYRTVFNIETTTTDLINFTYYVPIGNMFMENENYYVLQNIEAVKARVFVQELFNTDFYDGTAILIEDNNVLSAEQQNPNPMCISDDKLFVYDGKVTVNNQYFSRSRIYELDVDGETYTQKAVQTGANTHYLDTDGSLQSPLDTHGYNNQINGYAVSNSKYTVFFYYDQFNQGDYFPIVWNTTTGYTNLPFKLRNTYFRDTINSTYISHGLGNIPFSINDNNVVYNIHTLFHIVKHDIDNNQTYNRYYEQSLNTVNKTGTNKPVRMVKSKGLTTFAKVDDWHYENGVLINAGAIMDVDSNETIFKTDKDTTILNYQFNNNYLVVLLQDGFGTYYKIIDRNNDNVGIISGVTGIKDYYLTSIKGFDLKGNTIAHIENGNSFRTYNFTFGQVENVKAIVEIDTEIEDTYYLTINTDYNFSALRSYGANLSYEWEIPLLNITVNSPEFTYKFENVGYVNVYLTVSNETQNDTVVVGLEISKTDYETILKSEQAEKGFIGIFTAIGLIVLLWFKRLFGWG